MLMLWDFGSSREAISTSLPARWCASANIRTESLGPPYFGSTELITCNNRTDSLLLCTFHCKLVFIFCCLLLCRCRRFRRGMVVHSRDDIAGAVPRNDGHDFHLASPTHDVLGAHHSGGCVISSLDQNIGPNAANQIQRSFLVK